MTARREPVPPMRRPVDVLTQPTDRPAPRNSKIMVYLPPDLVADLDDVRSELRRTGRTVDRSQLIRAALWLAKARYPDWIDRLEDAA